MYPVLLDFKFFKIHSYGALMVIGFLAALYVLRKLSQKEKIDPNDMTDIAFWSFIMGLIGGRILHILTNLTEFIEAPQKIFYFWEGGLVYYGGFIAGVLTHLGLSYRVKIPMLKALDVTLVSLPLGHAFGRIGCLAAGCCYGRPIHVDSPLAVVFHHPEAAAPLGIPLHPTQLYESIGNIIVFILLLFLYRKKKFDGQMAAYYVLFYAINRFSIEIFRGDEIRRFVIRDILSTSQFIALVTAVLALMFLIWKQLQIKKNNS